MLHSIQPLSQGLKIPSPLLGMLFWIMASIAMFVCQRLVEHAAVSVDKFSRQITTSHAAIGVGSIIWTLDVAGFFIYEPGIVSKNLELIPALIALIIITLGCRVTIPTLAASTRNSTVILASTGLVIAILTAHCVIVNWQMPSVIYQDGWNIATAIFFILALTLYMSFSHQRVKLRNLKTPVAWNNWQDWVLGGGVILFIHWLLVNGVTSPPDSLTTTEPPANTLLLLLLIIGSSLAIGTELLFNLRSDRQRQQFFHQGLLLLRASHVSISPAQDHNLAMLADHFNELVHPDKLVLHFQPIVNLRSHSIHLEALLRLEHERLGRINPEQFFLACELHKRTVEVDKLIILNALQCLKRWQEQNMLPCISVNIAPITLLSKEFIPWLISALDKLSLPTHQLCLEITEHAIIAYEKEIVDVMSHLNSIGIRVVMDDFGVGYSSLSVLADLPIAGIKCDRLFLRNIQHEPRRQLLLRKVAVMCAELSIPVTIEGVETEEELSIVQQCGIDSIQGYFFARPMPAEEIPAWVSNSLPLLPSLATPF